MTPVYRRISIAMLLLIVSAPAQAWQPETRLELADEALRLMPASLRLVLEKHRQQVRRGMLEPMVHEDRPEHRAPWAGGSLDARFTEEIEGLIEALGRERPAFRDIAQRFGRVAHYVADAGFPPGVSRGDAAGRFGHFSSFCESRREKFPVVFYGHQDPDLERYDYQAYVLGVMRRAASEDEQLAAAYARAGDPPDPAAFDDRSVPFAVGSLAYSHSFTDIVRVWLHTWRQAGGDIGRTPYLKKQPTPAQQEAPRDGG